VHEENRAKGFNTIMIKTEKPLQNFRVLLVKKKNDDSKDTIHLLTEHFEQLYISNNIQEALLCFQTQRPSVLILNSCEHNVQDIELIQTIRKKNKDFPIIVLTQSCNEEYLLKLINLEISQFLLLPAKKEVLLKALFNTMLPKKTKFELAPQLILDLEKGELSHNIHTINLRKKELSFLKLLYENQNRITTYDMIQETIWQEKPMTHNALKTFIKELRKKIPMPIIDNVIQEGYRLNQS
jgi:DNA-binding response OmpR family regulator